MINIKELNKYQLVPYYLMSSFLYYESHPQWESPLTDTEYDDLCKRVLAEWETLDHPHKHLIDYFALSAGTGFYLKQDDYPQMTVAAAINWAESVVCVRGDS
jgi:hypothetical protein